MPPKRASGSTPAGSSKKGRSAGSKNAKWDDSHVQSIIAWFGVIKNYDKYYKGVKTKAIRRLIKDKLLPFNEAQVKTKLEGLLKELSRISDLLDSTGYGVDDDNIPLEAGALKAQVEADFKWYYDMLPIWGKNPKVKAPALSESGTVNRRAAAPESSSDEDGDSNDEDDEEDDGKAGGQKAGDEDLAAALFPDLDVQAGGHFSGFPAPDENEDLELQERPAKKAKKSSKPRGKEPAKLVEQAAKPRGGAAFQSVLADHVRTQSDASRRRYDAIDRDLDIKEKAQEAEGQRILLEREKLSQQNLLGTSYMALMKEQMMLERARLEATVAGHTVPVPLAPIGAPTGLDSLMGSLNGMLGGGMANMFPGVL